ncbi:hypothetical protein C5N14_23400 [Micromonospora sp. MW-13]|uniref:hypothetical protein n=1 Tax=Micromonospora sp. MW-13 TaxID=2094022 RepID=UPI000E43C035|nr:hypothetical protein [Micromonospora sp. MW-13]RGC66345.1 hypothetical protein C5N14_23400 [Micromonospora sp. MW-13]
MSPTQVVVTVLVVLVVVAALVVVGRQAARRRALRSRFGPEYDRMVTERDSRSAAERELRDRERRHAELTLTPLTPESRARYAAAWEELQIRFVDSPTETVSDADELVGRLVAERGYPSGEFSDQVAHLSVEHARTLSHYRDAHEIRLRNERGEAGTEELRQAVVHYRALFADLLGEDPVGVRAPEQRRPDATPEHRPDAGPDHRPDAGPDHQPDAGPADRPHDVTSR